MNQRIGIFGGTFNPVHMGHLIMAQDALEVFDLTKILFVPCNLPPHKDASRLASAEHRAAMLEKAVEDNPDFKVSDVEIRKGGTNYTIDTVRYLRQLYPRYDLFFIIGSDSLLELNQWKEIGELAQICSFVTFVRPGFDPRKISLKKFKLGKSLKNNLIRNVAAIHQVDISSSDIRRRAAEGRSIRYLVPSPVEIYIAEHNLYKT